MANHNCTIKYISGIQTAGVDSLYRLLENVITSQKTVFPDILNAIRQGIILIVQKTKIPIVKSLTTDSLDNQILYPEDTISEEALEGTALIKQDWRKAQASDRYIACLVSK